MWGFLFSFARPPLSSALSDLLAWIIPPPPGVGCASVYLICGCGRGGGLPACFLAVPLSRSRSFATAARFALRGVLLARSVFFLVGLFLICWRVWLSCVPLASSVGGPPRSPLPRPAILPDGRGADGVVLPLACLFILSGLWRCLRAGVRFSISLSGSLLWCVRRAG